MTGFFPFKWIIKCDLSSLQTHLVSEGQFNVFRHLKCKNRLENPNEFYLISHHIKVVTSILCGCVYK